MLVPLVLGAAAVWVYYRRSHGLPIVPSFGRVPQIYVLTPAGPALIPGSTQVTPVNSVTTSAALSLAQAAAQTQVSDGGVHAPRYIRPSASASADQAALGMFDPYDTMPASLRTDSMGVLRSYSLASRPFETR